MYVWEISFRCFGLLEPQILAASLFKPVCTEENRKRESAVWGSRLILVAEWIHFALFGIILPTIKLKVYTFGAYELSNEGVTVKVQGLGLAKSYWRWTNHYS